MHSANINGIATNRANPHHLRAAAYLARVRTVRTAAATVPTAEPGADPTPGRAVSPRASAKPRAADHSDLGGRPASAASHAATANPSRAVATKTASAAAPPRRSTNTQRGGRNGAQTQMGAGRHSPRLWRRCGRRWWGTGCPPNVVVTPDKEPVRKPHPGSRTGSSHHDELA